MSQNQEKPIGYLVVLPSQKLSVVGLCCKERFKKPNLLSHIYRVNIGPYKQYCCVCDSELVCGQTPAWPELYPDKLFLE